MAMSNLNLKGIWIPIEVLTDKNLSDKEKMILAIILFLSKENNNCFCRSTNKHININRAFVYTYGSRFKTNYDLFKYISGTI